MTELQNLLKEREALESKIREARQTQRAQAIASCKQLIETYELTASDLFGRGGRAKPASGNKVAPKYRNPETGDTWTGRGKPPKWIQDKSRDMYLIK